MTIEVDLREIKSLLSALNKKIDRVIEDRETLSLMVLAEKSLRDFLERNLMSILLKTLRLGIIER